MSSSRGISVIEVLIVIALLIASMALLFPVVRIGFSPESKAQAKNDVVQIATAVIAFETEYGRLPGTNSGGVSGDVLAALTGSIGEEVQKRVAVWSDPNLGTESWGWKAPKKQRRYVTSWD